MTATDNHKDGSFYSPRKEIWPGSGVCLAEQIIKVLPVGGWVTAGSLFGTESMISGRCHGWNRDTDETRNYDVYSYTNNPPIFRDRVPSYEKSAHQSPARRVA